MKTPAKERIRKSFSFLVTTTLLLTVFSTGCLDDDGDEEDDRVGVIVTIQPQLEFARRVGGDRVKVTVLVGEGQDPHTAQLTTGQLKDIARADLYFTVGSGVEYELANMGRILAQNDDMQVVDGSEGIQLIPFEQEPSPGILAGRLFQEGPYQEVLAADNESNAPAVVGGENCYNITFTGEGDNRTGVVKFSPEEEGSYVMLLGDKAGKLNFTLKNQDGQELDHTAEEHGFGGFGYHLEQENHTLNFGPTQENETKLVILEEHHEEHDHEHGETDPHIWNSPANAKLMIENLLEGLKTVDPDNADNYTRNANDYLAELEALDQEFKAELEPYVGREFLVYHPSFGYLAHDYQLVQLAIQEGGKEPTPAGLQAIIDQAKEKGITVVFVAPQFSTVQAQTIAEEIDGSVLVIDPLGREYLNNMKLIRTELLTGFQAAEV